MSAIAQPLRAPVRSPLLEGPITSTLLRLALPNMLALSMAVLVSVAETYYVGSLGTAALAAMALVFPFAMLTQMLSNGAMGSGVSSAISRALGAGEVERASALGLHALVIGAVAGLVYSLVFVFLGPVFYGWLGGRGEVLAQASGFGSVLFSGALLVWVCNTLASVVRGTGNMRLPSGVLLLASLVQVVVGGALGLGLGPLPRWGLPGVALGNIAAMVLAVAVLLAYLQWGQQRIRLDWRAPRLSRAMFSAILRVGALACLSPLQTALAALLLTGMVARLGPAALAGYGIGQRLEFLLIPMAFGVGMAAVPMVGMALGAGQVQRARSVAWISGVMVTAMLGALGLMVWIWPRLWSGLFTQDAAVLAHADLYLRMAAPAFGLFGLGLVLYFASLGAGRVLGPVFAGTLRLALIAGGGAWLMHGGQASAQALFGLVGLAMAAYGLATAWSVWRARWD
ncbi:MATE family efflux transporter [Comamonas composti]|uniref:MATE family efflux transporter n=1 Tax=Comamonas composti TaxID=408558 RepID=UPI0003FDF5C7|nr:MATE family efflux transporter [Comamonas composti]